MIEYIMYNGQSLRQFGVVCSGGKRFNSASRNYELIDVQGRNGYLLKDNGTYNSIIVNYDCFIVKDLQSNLQRLRNFLGSDFGIHQLEDTFDPNEYRMGTFGDGIEYDIFNLQGANFTLSFTCQPERWLKDGQKPRTLTKSTVMVNPTRFASKPLIRVYGQGNLGIGNQQIQITQSGTEYIDIDSDLCDCYEGTTYRNDRVVLENHQFPTLEEGKSNITLETGISRVIITPRWWQL